MKIILSEFGALMRKKHAEVGEAVRAKQCCAFRHLHHIGMPSGETLVSVECLIIAFESFGELGKPSDNKILGRKLWVPCEVDL